MLSESFLLTSYQRHAGQSTNPSVKLTRSPWPSTTHTRIWIRLQSSFPAFQAAFNLPNKKGAVGKLVKPIVNSVLVLRVCIHVYEWSTCYLCGNLCLHDLFRCSSLRTCFWILSCIPRVYQFQLHMHICFCVNRTLPTWPPVHMHESSGLFTTSHILLSEVLGRRVCHQ